MQTDEGRRAHRVGYNLIAIKRERNNYLIKKYQEILPDLADFPLEEQTEDNLMVVISRAWYNGSYTMAAKPIKSPELPLYNDPFLIIVHIGRFKCSLIVNFKDIGTLYSF